MFGQLVKYAFINARIRAMLSCFISPDLFSSLSEAKDLNEVIENLKETSYRGILEGMGEKVFDLKFLERRLLKNEVDIYRKIRDSLATAQEKNLVSLLMQRFELEQVKLAFRTWHSRGIKEVSAGDYPAKEKICYNIEYDKIAAARNIDEIILLLKHTPYRNPVLSAKAKFEEKNLPFYLEIALDVDYYRRLLASVKKLSLVDRRAAHRILGIEIDIENIAWVIKLSKYYSIGTAEIAGWIIPGGSRINSSTVRKIYAANNRSPVFKDIAPGPYAGISDLAEEDAGSIENFLYGILAKEVRGALRGFPFTIGTVLGYLVLKRRETKNLIALLYAKSFGWGKEKTIPLLNLC